MRRKEVEEGEEEGKEEEGEGPGEEEEEEEKEEEEKEEEEGAAISVRDTGAPDATVRARIPHTATEEWHVRRRTSGKQAG